MEQVNNTALAMLQATAGQTGLTKAGKSDSGELGDFQKLLEEKSQAKDTLTEERPKTEKPAAAAKKEAPAQKKEEDPVEAGKRLQVYLTPVSPEELSQYPAEWLPDVAEGEPIVCIGVHTGENGEQIPTLVGASAAQRMYGKEVIAPEMMEQPQGEIEIPEEMLQAPEHMEELPVAEKAPVAEAVSQEAQPQEDDSEVEVTEAEQAPQRIFKDVEAAPVKVGEVYEAEQTEKADVARQIDAGLAQALERGESLVRIQLTPENLGSVTVEISQGADGVLRIALSAHSGETRGLLERHAADLQGLLTSRTQQSVEVDVQRQTESQQNQNHQNYDGHNGHAQNGQERRRQQREHTSSQDFIQQLRLGLIPTDGED